MVLGSCVRRGTLPAWSAHREAGAIGRPAETGATESDDVGEQRDSWEGAFWEASEPRDVSATIDIEYRDSAGAKTQRVVQTRSFDNRLHGGLLIGHCALRNATRTFRFDRVLSAVDVSTGEVIADLQAHLNQLYDSSPERARDALAERFRELLRVLLYVAKADGQYRREEKVVVRDFCRQLTSDPRMNDDMIDALFAGLKVPSLPAFKVAVDKVFEQQLCDPARLQQVCAEIVETQSTRTACETEALDYISQRVTKYERATGSAA